MKREKVAKNITVPAHHPHDRIPPTKLRSLHTEGPNLQNSKISVVRAGVEQIRVPYSKFMERKFESEIPEVPVKKTENGEEIVEVMGGGKDVPEIRKGAPPLLQLIYKKSPWGEGIEKDELVTLVNSVGWYDGIDLDTEKMVELGAEKLVKNDLLTVSDNRYYAGPKKLESYFELGEDGHDLEGPYPAMKLARQKASERGARKIVALVDIIFDEWNYTLSRESAWNWVDRSIEKGYLRKIDEKTVEPFRAL